MCLGDPLRDYHSGENKIRDALTKYKKSAHFIFGMLQAAANDGNRSALLVPERKHLELLGKRGHQFVRDGLRYAAYAQYKITSAKLRNRGKGWLLPK